MLHLTYNCRLSPEFYRLPEAVTSRILAGALASLGNEFSIDDGLILASSRLKKSQKIKPGRVLARLLDDPEEVQRLAALLVAAPYTWEIVTGSAIADYYRDSAVRSCMTFQDSEVFDLYAKNPDQIGLCVMHDEEGNYLGRTLIYMKEGKPEYHSRRIYMPDEHAILTRDYLGKLGVGQIPDSVIDWPLNKCHHDRYPYLDDFAGVDSDGLTDRSPDYTCDQTTGYCQEHNRAPCDCCRDLEDSEDLIYLGEDHNVCSHCYERHYYTAEDSRGNPCTFYEDAVTTAETVDNGDVFAEVDDCVQEAERIKSDFSELELIRLSDGTIGTEDELLDEGYTQIDDYWTTEARCLSEYVLGSGWYASRSDRLDY